MPAISTIGQQIRQQQYSLEVFSGDDTAAKRLRLQVGRIAPHFRCTLLIGETGLGKQTIAQELHRLSPAASATFITLDLSELISSGEPPEGTGTCYLRGLQHLNAAQQQQLPSLLKTLERRWRVVLGSQFDPRGLVAAGRMDPELLQVLAVPAIHVTPLRERSGQLDHLAASMLRRAGHGASFSPAAFHVLRRHNWPTNLAGLWDVCAQAGRPGAVVEPADLPPHLLEHSGETLRLDEVVARHVRDVLQRCAGNKLRAAELLGISRSTLYRMMEP